MSSIYTANCLVWMLAARRRLPCYVMMRKSRGGWYPHFLLMTFDRQLKRRRSDPDDEKRACRHIFSFIPAAPTAYDRPTPFYKVGMFSGHMVLGDHVAVGKSYKLTVGRDRYSLLKAVALVLLAAVMVCLWAGWWAWRLWRIGWEIALAIP